MILVLRETKGRERQETKVNCVDYCCEFAKLTEEYFIIQKYVTKATTERHCNG